MANFQNFWQIFGIFGVVVVVVVVEDFGSWVFRIFGEFSEFSENIRRKKTKKSLVLRISRYSIWEVRYDILFDILKSPVYRHSIISRYDMPTPVWDYLETTLKKLWYNFETNFGRHGDY